MDVSSIFGDFSLPIENVSFRYEFLIVSSIQGVGGLLILIVFNGACLSMTESSRVLSLESMVLGWQEQ